MKSRNPIPLVTHGALAAATLVLLFPVSVAGGRRHGAMPPGRNARDDSAVPPAPRAHPAAARTHTASPRAPGVVEEHVHLRRGDTLLTLLRAQGVSQTEAQPFVAAASLIYDLRQMRPRRGMTLTFDRGTRRLEGIRYEIDGRSRLVVERTPKGVHARRTTLPYVIEVKGAAGRIDRGLYADAVAAGVPDRVVSELAQIFEWKVDFGSDLRPGDEYRVLYENIWEAGGHAGEPGKVLGAEIVTRGKPMTAVFFEDADGQGGYYDPDGESLASDFLRYPCEFRKITSLFSRGRRHPVLGRRRPHLAVDFAAPYGTPVHAVATGKVDSTGWLRQLGRYIRVDHADALRSTYGHLARIAPGIRAGSTVARGQVIGYVGRTGLATGNHLHFAIDRDGEPVDPLTALAHAPSRVPAVARRAFERARQAVVRSLGALPRTERPMTVSLAGARAE